MTRHAAVQRMVNRNRPAADQQVLHRRRHDAAVRNLVILVRLEHAHLRPRAARIMNVHRIVDPGDRILETGLPVERLDGQVLEPENPPRLAHADLRRNRMDLGMLVPRNRRTQECEVLPQLFSRDDLRVGKFLGVRRIVLDDPVVLK